MIRLYPHDCEQCVYLGVTGHYDLYVCAKMPVWTTLLARYGWDADYLSAPPQAVVHWALIEALQRAKDRGLICDDPVG